MGPPRVEDERARSARLQLACWCAGGGDHPRDATHTWLFAGLARGFRLSTVAVVTRGICDASTAASAPPLIARAGAAFTDAAREPPSIGGGVQEAEWKSWFGAIPGRSGLLPKMRRPGLGLPEGSHCHGICALLAWRADSDCGDGTWRGLQRRRPGVYYCHNAPASPREALEAKAECSGSGQRHQDPNAPGWKYVAVMCAVGDRTGSLVVDFDVRG